MANTIKFPKLAVCNIFVQQATYSPVNAIEWVGNKLDLIIVQSLQLLLQILYANATFLLTSLKHVEHLAKQILHDTVFLEVILLPSVKDENVIKQVYRTKNYRGYHSVTFFRATRLLIKSTTQEQAASDYPARTCKRCRKQSLRLNPQVLHYIQRTYSRTVKVFMTDITWLQIIQFIASMEHCCIAHMPV